MKTVESLIVNITDMCNMECEFCLRGDRGVNKMDLSLIPRIFDGIDCIENLTITGGEPSLYEEAVTAIVDYIEEKDIDCYGCFIVTNGKVYSQALVDAVKKLLLRHIRKTYANEYVTPQVAKYIKSEFEEMYSFGIAVSIDMYHEAISVENYIRYRMSGVYSDVKETDFSNGGVIARGRGSNIYGAKEREYRELYVSCDDGDIIVEELYISIDGDVFSDCDISYDMQGYIEPEGNLHEETLAEIIERKSEEAV